MTPGTYGFRIVGATTEARRLINWAAAFEAYAACDPRANVEREAYLSAFTFGTEFRKRADDFGRLDVKGYGGPCTAPFIWFDLDRARLEDALQDARRLAVYVDERLKLPDDVLLIFFSGSKGFHLGLPTALWAPEAAVDFHRTARRFVERLAESAAVPIDAAVYDKVRAFRAPNSRHPKSGLFKRQLSTDELLGLSLDGILKLAENPSPFDVPSSRGRNEIAALEWEAAGEDIARRANAVARLRLIPRGSLNRATFDFIRDGALEGDRHRMLFSAAANLAEFNCPSALAHALLAEAGRDSGLPPKEVQRQIECGLAAKGSCNE